MTERIEEKIDKRIKKEFLYDFEIKKEGLYAIEISGRAKNWLQNTLQLISFFKGDDLAVKINGKEFQKLSGKRGLFDSEAAWNGNALKNLQQINIFLIYLDTGRHSLKFIADQSPLLETIRIYQVTSEKNIVFEPVKNYQIESGNRRPWLNFILIDIALEGLKIQASANQKQGDDGDLQLRINGEWQINDAPKAHKYWYWCGRILRGQSKTFDKELNLSAGLHYIELWADNEPQVNSVLLQFNKFLIERRLKKGKIALYRDIVAVSKVAQLRSEADNTKDNIIKTLEDGAKLIILEERVVGTFVSPLSYIWHKVKFGDQEGFVLSSLVEIDGQEREIIVNKIRRKAIELGADPNLMIALAGCESRYKPYASSRSFEEKNEDGRLLAARGIFQLTNPAIDQLIKNKSEYYFEVKDPFDIEQNINGGVIYLKWLLDTYYKNTNQETEKLIAAYNQGQRYFPSNEPLDYSRLPTKEKQEEAKRSVKCVLENRKNKNWKFIIFSFLSFIIFGSFGVLKLDRNDFFEPIVSEKEYLMAQTSRFPSVISLELGEERGEEIIFFNSQKKIAKKISVEKLRLDDIFKTPEEFKKLNITHINGEVIESPRGVFYFLAANSYSCGMQNCGWVFYQYDNNKNSLRVISEDFFGTDISLDLSPNHKKMAMISYVHGSVCDTGSYLEIFDLDSFHKEEIMGFKDAFYPTTYIDSLNWEGDRQINFTAYHHDCADLTKRTVERRFIYNIENKKIELKSEKVLSSS